MKSFTIKVNLEVDRKGLSKAEYLAQYFESQAKEIRAYENKALQNTDNPV